MKLQVVVAVTVMLCSVFTGQTTAIRSLSDVFGSSQQQAIGPIQEECVQFGRQGSCQFYVCFEQRHPCESNNYALDYGWRFCSLFDTYRGRLSERAQQWLNDTRVCAMEQLINIYRSPSVRCDEVASFMKNAQAACEVQHGLCSSSLLTENRDVFTDVYTVNRRSAANFLYAVKHCTMSMFREVSSWFEDHLGHSRVVPVLRQLRDHVRDHVRDFRDDVSNEARRFRSLFTSAVEENSVDPDDNDDVIVG